MISTAGLARSPYFIEAYARVCSCRAPVVLLARHSKIDRAIDNAAGLWALIVGFYGEYQVVMHIEVIDRRDGRVIWRDGRRLTEEDQYGEDQAA